MSQRTRILVGAASADVALVKVSAPAKDVKYETRRVFPNGAPLDTLDDVAPDVAEADITATDDPFEASVAHTAAVGTANGDPLPNTYVQRGVTNASGEWVDLTDELTAIDERNKLDGMAIEFTVALSALPRILVRDAYYLTPTSDSDATFLAFLWNGLVPTGTAAIVRWTKRTGQYLGAIVGYGAGSKPRLVLYELEWAANMRPVPPDCVLDIASVPESGSDQAAATMSALRRSPGALDDLVDQRSAERRELLMVTRAGETWEAPQGGTVSEAELALGAFLEAVTT